MDIDTDRWSAKDFRDRLLSGDFTGPFTAENVKRFMRTEATLTKRDKSVITPGDIDVMFTEWELLGELKSLANGTSDRSDTRNDNVMKANRVAAAAVGRRTGRDDIDDFATQHGLKSFRLPKPQDLDNFDNGGYRGIGDYLNDVRDAHRGVAKAQDRLEKYNTRNLTTKDQSHTTGSTGGFLIPEAFRMEVLMGVDAEQSILNRRRVFTTAHGNLSIPVLNDANRSGGDIAGAAMTRTNENTTITESTITFQARNTLVSKMATLVEVPNELPSDTPLFNSLCVSVLSRAVANQQMDDYLNGSGVDEPQGILVATDRYEQAKETSQPAATIKGTNAFKLRSRIASGRNAEWLAHPSTIPQLMTLFVQGKTDAGTNVAAGGLIYIEGGERGLPPTLLGNPVSFTGYAQLVGTVGDLILTDPTSYIYVMHSEGIVIDVSPHVNFDKDQTVYRVRLRDSGFPWRGTTQRDQRNWEIANTVTLATRS